MMFTYAPKIPLADTSTPKFNASSEPRWYLAYGSNLSSAVFLGRRNIVPLAKEVVLAKGIELVFDNAGIPYVEPRFANCRISSEPASDFRPDEEWTGIGCLIGVAYLVTASDFRKIVATEGGGTSYQPLLVDANVITQDGQVSTENKKVYTLQSRATRKEYGEPSLRYMTLIRNGAREHPMPESYIKYLDNLPHYHISNFSQRIGRGVYIATWLPSVMLFFLMVAYLSDKDGNVAPWAGESKVVLFRAMWSSYDWMGRYVFGNAEETQYARALQ